MFSEVYWHHAVRSATAMMQRAFYHRSCCVDHQFDIGQLSTLDDESFVSSWMLDDPNNITGQALFGPRRQLYKRLLDFSADQNPEMYDGIAHRPYEWLCETGRRLAEELSSAATVTIEPDELLIDAPPTGLEVQFKVTVRDGDQFRQLEDVSPVVKSLAQRQFDDFVKKVRVFVHPRLAPILDAEFAVQRLESIL
jgi:HD superfamily phosphohydrolase